MNLLADRQKFNQKQSIEHKCSEDLLWFPELNNEYKTTQLSRFTE